MKERMAKALWEARNELSTLDKWENAPESVKQAYRLEADIVIKKLDSPRPMNTTRDEMRVGLITMFGLGVSYASPLIDRNPAFKEQVQEQAEKQADLYLKGLK